MLPEFIDSWLLELFPGRFLEEIDEVVDWARFMRAYQARNATAVEKIRKQLISGTTKQESLSADILALIEEHDRLFAQWLTQSTS